MQTKLTLRLDEELIRKARVHAEESGKSVSQLVAEYFALLGRPRPVRKLTPTVARLKGALRGSGISIEDYREHLERKYL